MFSCVGGEIDAETPQTAGGKRLIMNRSLSAFGGFKNRQMTASRWPNFVALFSCWLVELLRVSRVSEHAWHHACVSSAHC